MTATMSSPASCAAKSLARRFMRTSTSSQTPTHVLVIPKGEYASLDDFSEKASAGEIAALVRALGRVAQEQGVAEAGYRVLANSGAAAHQEVPHFHVHLFGGRDLGGMLPRR